MFIQSGIESVNNNHTLMAKTHSAHQCRKGRLAASVGANQGDNLTGSNAQRDVMQVKTRPTGITQRNSSVSYLEHIHPQLSIAASLRLAGASAHHTKKGARMRAPLLNLIK